MSRDDELFPLVGLVERVEAALAAHPAIPSSGRVREVPDVRTIRYYTTLGLLDRPAGMKGRTALYGPRHVWQLVAIKALQARGCALVEVQRRLLGLDEAALRALAAAPAGDVPAPPPPRRAARPSFWKLPPVPPTNTGPPAEAPPPPPHEEASPAPPDAPRVDAPGEWVSTGIPLGAGLLLLVPPRARLLSPSEREALRRAAAPLVSLFASLDDQEGDSR